MRVTFSDVSIRKGLLRVRANVFIDDPLSKTYSKYYVQTALIPTPDSIVLKADYKAWLAALPENQKIWRLAPVLCRFITVPENLLVNDLAEYVARLFDKNTIATLDNALVRPNSAHLISPYMRTKRPFSDKRVSTQDFADLVAITNQKLGSIPDIILEGGGRVTPLEPQTIDIGTAADDRASSSTAAYTIVIRDNPANATGTLDTIEFFAEVGDVTNLQVGTFFVVSGLNLSTRDVDESLGTATAGVKTTFSSLNIDVETDEWLGFDIDTGRTSFNSGAGTQPLLRSDFSDAIPCTNEAFEAQGDFVWSCFGTGVETAAGIGARVHRLNPLGINQYGPRIG